MTLLLLLSHVCACAVWVWFTRYEVSLNAAMILADGAGDTLKASFHSRRSWVRFWWWLGCTVLGSLAISFASLIGFLISFGALGILLGGYFLRTFNPMLNASLGLPYKARFYLSPSPTAAAFPDRFLWAHLRQKIDNPTQEQANLANQLFLNVVLGVSVVGYVGLMAWLLLSR